MEIPPPEIYYTALEYLSTCIFLHPNRSTDVLTDQQRDRLRQYYEITLDEKKLAALINMDLNIYIYK
jgi:hypothetical protein